jgi:hypothetical protein
MGIIENQEQKEKPNARTNRPRFAALGFNLFPGDRASVLPGGLEPPTQ